MAMVRFAQICDASDCGRRSEEYTRWAECRECGRDLCPAHYDSDAYDPETNKCICNDCNAMDAAG